MPDWNRTLSMPFHTIKLPKFLFAGLFGSCTIFIPLSFKQDIGAIENLILFALVFALINAILEEVIWRGVMLSSLRDNVSPLYAVCVTSIGFGLLHLSIGMPLLTSLLFSFGGLFYAIVVLKTNSLYPAITFHIIINLGMVLNGWIL
ncbi:CPBP family intramembrane glutamic endopeptidase [Fictibacillus iocasae]|uniref:CPBP family intramembrane glutamic endopeptidase n=1 Tax=Fictibacillus iocasae TaxID=2715437 RepID=A0ABW2NP96_9BACL